ncbi:MAG: LapA family protein [Firmicutes bacterium]|nr:LapA family protein [Bacillota bacterium]
MWKLVLALLFALVVAIFAVQNAGLVMVGFLPYRFEVSLALVILGSTAAGALVVFLLGLVQQVTRGMKIREYRHKIQQLERELAALQEEMAEPTPRGEEGVGVEGNSLP